MWWSWANSSHLVSDLLNEDCMVIFVWIFIQHFKPDLPSLS